MSKNPGCYLALVIILALGGCLKEKKNIVQNDNAVPLVAAAAQEPVAMVAAQDPAATAAAPDPAVAAPAQDPAVPAGHDDQSGGAKAPASGALFRLEGNPFQIIDGAKEIYLADICGDQNLDLIVRTSEGNYISAATGAGKFIPGGALFVPGSITPQGMALEFSPSGIQLPYIVCSGTEVDGWIPQAHPEGFNSQCRQILAYAKDGVERYVALVGEFLSRAGHRELLIQAVGRNAVTREALREVSGYLNDSLSIPFPYALEATELVLKFLPASGSQLARVICQDIRTGAVSVVASGLSGSGYRSLLGTHPGELRISTGDLTGDGLEDLLVHEVSTGRIAIYQCDAAGGAAPCPLAGLQENLSPAVYGLIADLDHDGKADVLLVTADAVKGLFRDGEGFFPRSFPLPLSFPAVVAVADDLNGDGRPDLVVTCANEKFQTLINIIGEDGDTTSKP